MEPYEGDVKFLSLHATVYTWCVCMSLNIDKIKDLVLKRLNTIYELEKEKAIDVDVASSLKLELDNIMISSAEEVVLYHLYWYLRKLWLFLNTQKISRELFEKLIIYSDELSGALYGAS